MLYQDMRNVYVSTMHTQQLLPPGVAIYTSLQVLVFTSLWQISSYCQKTTHSSGQSSDIGTHTNTATPNRQRCYSDKHNGYQLWVIILFQINCLAVCLFACFLRPSHSSSLFGYIRRETSACCRGVWCGCVPV